MTDTRLIELTADIVSAHVSNNDVAASDVAPLIQSIFNALSKAEQPAAAEATKQEPAVPVRSSVKQDYIVCLEDGKKLKMLKRYLRTNFNMTPEDYRAKWNLPRDYPMVAPAYAEQRRDLAKSIGLGRKPKTVLEAVVAPVMKVRKTLGIAAGKAMAAVHFDTTTDAPAPAKRGRAKKVVEPLSE